MTDNGNIPPRSIIYIELWHNIPPTCFVLTHLSSIRLYYIFVKQKLENQAAPVCVFTASWWSSGLCFKDTEVNWELSSMKSLVALQQFFGFDGDLETLL